MLRIFKIILYIILLNTYLINNLSNASLLDFLKNMFLKENTNDEQVFDRNNNPIELKIPINTYILNQIKEINNVDIKNKEKHRIKDDNFNIIQSQQRQIIELFEDYFYSKEVFNICLNKVQSLILVMDFIKKLSIEINNDLKQLLNSLYEDLNNYKNAINKLFKSFNKMLNVINLIKLVFKNNNGIIDKLMQIDHTGNISENIIESILKNYIHQLDILLDKETIKYYDNNLHEILIKIRSKKSVLPSQLLFMIFNFLKEEIINQNGILCEDYIIFKNKVRNINQKIDSINDYIKDTMQNKKDNNYYTGNTSNNIEDNEKLIVSFIDNNISEQNRSNRDINDEIERIQNINKTLVENLNIFKNYNYDERILSLMQEEKDKKQNQFKIKTKEHTYKMNSKSSEKDNRDYNKKETNKSENK